MSPPCGQKDAPHGQPFDASRAADVGHVPEQFGTLQKQLVDLHKVMKLSETE